MHKLVKKYAIRHASRWLMAMAACFGTGAFAQGVDPAEKSGLRSFLEQDYLLGDWGGLRKQLSDHGVDFEFFYAGSVPNNLSGGLRRGAVYQGALLMTLDLDSSKLVGYEGGLFHAGALWLHGEKPFSDHFIGDLNKVNLIDFPNLARLWDLWYQQKLFDGKVTLKLGKMSVDRDFIVPEIYNSLASVTLLNQTFFYPTLAFDVWDIAGFPKLRHGLASTPYASPAALLRYEPVPQVYAQAAVYGGNPDQSYSGTEFDLSEREGALAYFELGYRLNQQKTDTGLEGAYKFGGYYHTGDFLDLNQAVMAGFFEMAGLPVPAVDIYSGNYGFYFLAEQQFFREIGKEDAAKQGLAGFFRVGGAPADRNLADFGVDGGVVYRGLIPSRDWDTLAFAGSYLRMSDDIRSAQRQINQMAPGTTVELDYEAVLELSYKFQLAAWWTLQPSLQRVFHPGGSPAIKDATVLILQTTFRF